MKLIVITGAADGTDAELPRRHGAGVARREQPMHIKVRGSVWCTHAALPWPKQRHASNVAVSSLAGLIGVPGRAAYSGAFSAAKRKLLRWLKLPVPARVEAMALAALKKDI